MTTIAFFNNKGGVGTTSLVYHLAWMLKELDRRVIVADLDPQANLTGMFYDETSLAHSCKGPSPRTVDGCVAPLFEGTSDIVESPRVERVDQGIGLLMGSLALSTREDELSAQWPKCLDGDGHAFRVTTAFGRLIAKAANEFDAELALVDVGPNLGAINRAALIASDCVVIPLAPDLSSLLGLRNTGPTLRHWRNAWQERVAKKPGALNIGLPAGDMNPVGYVIVWHAMPFPNHGQTYGQWINSIPSEYANAVMHGRQSPTVNGQDPNCLAHLRDYRSLKPMAEEAGRPMFLLRPAHGAIGSHQLAVSDCYSDFRNFASELLKRLESDRQLPN